MGLYEKKNGKYVKTVGGGGTGGGSGGSGGDGVGIQGIALKSAAETGNTYTILLTDGTTYDFVAPAGPAGADGISPEVDDYGSDDDNTTVAFTDGSVIQIPNGVGIKNIRLQTKADTGNTYNIELTNGQDYEFVAPAGPTGKTGGDGVGILSIKPTDAMPTGLTYTIYLTDGSSYDFTAPAGPAGEDGEPGVGIRSIDYDEYSGEFTVWYTDNHKESFPGPTLPETGGGDNIPDYVRTEAERVAKVVQSRQNANTITFIACSDIHYSSPDNSSPISTAANVHEATLHMGQAMGIIRERVHVDFAAMMGDMIRDNGEVSVDEIQAEVRFVNECLHKGFSGIPAFRIEGNHDEAYESGVGLSAGQVFANIHAWNTDVVFGDRAGGYCYRDFEGVKLRVICLNTTEGSGSSIYVSAAQGEWLANALNLSEKGNGWCSVILSHQPLDFSRSGGVDIIPTIKAAPGLIGAFHGHIHNFLVDYITGTEVKRIAIPNAVRDQENSYTTNNGVNFAESTKYTKTAGTAQDTSFCVVTIDLAARKIYADHYGAGYSREIDYTYKSSGVNYTNLVKTSTVPVTGAVYGDDNNGDGAPDGYRNGKYASGANEGTDANCVLTGLIAYGTGVTTPIYIRGAAVDTSQSHCRIIAFNAAQEAAFQSAAGSEIPTYFTVETLGDSYYKLTPTAKWTSDVAYCNYLRFSLIGTGENLVITVGEPIE